MLASPTAIHELAEVQSTAFRLVEVAPSGFGVGGRSKRPMRRRVRAAAPRSQSRPGKQVEVTSALGTLLCGDSPGKRTVASRTAESATLDEK